MQWSPRCGFGQRGPRACWEPEVLGVQQGRAWNSVSLPPVQLWPCVGPPPPVPALCPCDKSGLTGGLERRPEPGPCGRADPYSAGKCPGGGPTPSWLCGSSPASKDKSTLASGPASRSPSECQGWGPGIEKVPGEGGGETQGRFSRSPPTRRRWGARDPRRPSERPGDSTSLIALSQTPAACTPQAASALPALWAPGPAVGGDAAVTDLTPAIPACWGQTQRPKEGAACG